ncbi:hypothetical protein [Lachnotalea sp. AF33-28]|uniref:hypothetical protein n=1 Tax=Lachnotalea sp. AF33-28 TaxID=2292046 RepID=UPI000E4CEF8F|nr:hypothetical protein [Lachnotalea sp. AF33-28]RHP34943.1 hypothetical protein DWZ56_05370 [Lachnotalea sp. AF33-28]
MIKNRKDACRQLIKGLLSGIFIAVLLEITLFNFRHYESLFYEPARDVKVTYQGLTLVDDNIYHVDEEGESFIELNFPYQKIDSIHLDMQQQADSDLYTNGIRATIYVSDEGNQDYYQLPDQILLHDSLPSQYINLHLYGDSFRIKVVINEMAGKNVIIHDLSLNPQRPMSISWSRVVIVAMILWLGWLLRPNSQFYKYRYNPRKIWQRAVIIAAACVQIAFLWFMIYQADYSDNPDLSPYPALAEVLAKGQLYLDDQPDPRLAALDNPYDPGLRGAEGVEYLWDYAYYNGRYYVYFGVIPALIFYLPYYLITGGPLRMHLDFYICGAAFVVGIMLLVHQLIKKYFRKTPFLFYLLFSSLMIMGSGVLYSVVHSDFYNVPRITAITSAVLGLYFWLSAEKEGNSGLTCSRLALGSLFIALIAGCRPQMLLIGFTAVPLFWKYFVKVTPQQRREHRYAAQIAAFALPLIAVGAALMVYNTLRFGSPVDFGANYNLTTNDMTRRGFVLDRIGLGIFSYLFQTPNMISQFPFFAGTAMETSYMGTTVSDTMYGGLFTSNIILLAGCFFYRFRSALKDKKIYLLTILLLGSGFAVMVADTQMAGILFGYIGDFAVFFFLAAVIVLLAMVEWMDDRAGKGEIYALTAFLCFLSYGYNIFILFTNSIIDLKRSLYQALANGIQFWQ